MNYFQKIYINYMCFKKKGLKITTIIEGLKNGNITFLKNNHRVNPIIRNIEERMRFYTYINYGDSVCDVDIYCFNCGLRMSLFLIDEKTVALYHGDKYDFYDKRKSNNIKLDDIKDCITTELLNNKKLCSEIECSTGKIIFQNCFQTEHLHTDPNNKYGYPDINSLLGRNELMQYLSTQNVGYGQMGNMGVSVYSNNKDEIIITEYGSCLEEQMDDDPGFTDEERESSYNYYKREKEKNDRKNSIIYFKEYLKNNNHKYLGKISLSVWRWSCADESVLKLNNEEIGKDAVIANVKPGIYEIEHYFDFLRNNQKENIIYSRIKLK